MVGGLLHRKPAKLGPETQCCPLLALCPEIDLSRPQIVSLSLVLLGEGF